MGEVRTDKPGAQVQPRGTILRGSCDVTWHKQQLSLKWRKGPGPFGACPAEGLCPGCLGPGAGCFALRDDPDSSAVCQPEFKLLLSSFEFSKLKKCRLVGR